MVTVKEHYDGFLSKHYSWMCGDENRLVSETVAFFSDYIFSEENALQAVDLGAGSGIQTLALSKLNFSVDAIDVSKHLVDELRSKISSENVSCFEKELVTSLESYNDNSIDVIVCTGDTISHLESIERVEKLISECRRTLLAGGHCFFSYRDLTHELHREDRIIPVRLEKEKIMMTFLEYHPGFVQVNDSILIREENDWKLNKSSYRKLRIPIGTLAEMFHSNGMEIMSQEESRGLWTIVATKK